jgi:glyoxylase-like metal-dependent hydrolase (beta-lactamase superfamily II)
VNLHEVAPGLWYWTAPHPDWHGATDWPEEVGCVCYRAPAATVLIDPLLPSDEEEALFELVDNLGLPVEVLLTASWHKRDAEAVAARYGTTVWAHARARQQLDFPTRSDGLPDGVHAFTPEGDREGQVAFHIPEHETLVVAELFMGAGGGLRLYPSPTVRDLDAFRRSLRTLLDLPIERVLVAHGDPVLSGGRGRIAAALNVA